MRNLIITREKTFVACLMTLKIYIEDHDSSEIIINDVPCRKLGTIKNGEQKSFQIEDRGAKVFVIADKITRHFCNEYFEVPAGTFDVALKGKNHYNPFEGNPFRFDGTANEDVIAHRKTNKRKSIIFFSFCFIIGIALGIIVNLDTFSTEPKTFTNNEFSITLTDEFQEAVYEDIDICYETNDIAVLVNKEDKQILEGYGIETADDYAEFIIVNNGLESEIQNTDALTFFEYTAESNSTYKYLAAVFTTDSACWLIQFGILESDYEEHQSEFIDWAKTIVIR